MEVVTWLNQYKRQVKNIAHVHQAALTHNTPHLPQDTTTICKKNSAINQRCPLRNQCGQLPVRFACRSRALLALRQPASWGSLAPQQGRLHGRPFVGSDVEAELDLFKVSQRCAVRRRPGSPHPHAPWSSIQPTPQLSSTSVQRLGWNMSYEAQPPAQMQSLL